MAAGMAAGMAGTTGAKAGETKAGKAKAAEANAGEGKVAGRLAVSARTVRAALPGFLLAAVIALAAQALATRYGAPAMLFALLIGMAFHHLAAEPRTAPGIALTSRTLLRLGVALLGLRLSFTDIASLGWAPVLGVVGLTALTIGVGVGLAVLLRRGAAFGVLAGGAVAICGASAALALASVLPKGRIAERDVIFTVAGVTTLSTVAMILYPVLFAWMEHAPAQAGFLIGATIHDVAQVVGAGYSMGETTGDIATFVKLQRVALLPVALIAVTLLFREGSKEGSGEGSEEGSEEESGEGGAGGVSVPWFLTAFVALVLANNLLPLPAWLLEGARAGSAWLLLAAIAALGVKTSLKEMAKVGPRAAAVLVTATLVLLAAAISLERMVF